MAVTQEGLSAVSEPPAETVIRPESAGRLILFAIGWWLLIELVSGFPVGVAIGVLKRTHSPNLSLANPIPLTIMAFLAGCTFLFAVRRRSLVVGHGNRRAGVNDGPITRWWFLAVLALLAIIWAFFASSFWVVAVPQWVSSWRGESPWTLAAFGAVSVLLAPLAEELFFRGWLWTGLRQHWRAFPAALVSCSLWLLVHIDRGLLVPIILIPTAIILGFARHFCGIRAAIILHAIYNLAVVVILWALLTEMSSQAQQQLNGCRGWDGATPDVQIEGCTAIIEAGKYIKKDIVAAYVNRGIGYRAKRDNDRAIADYNMALQLDPNQANALMNRGNAYWAKGELDRAIADYDESIRLAPNNASAFHNRGLVYHNKKDYDRAIADQTRAITLGASPDAMTSGDDAFTRLSLDRSNADHYSARGDAYKAKKDFDRAIADYSEAIRLDPKLARRFGSRGLAYEDKNDFTSAILDFDAATMLAPENAGYWNSRCWVRALAGQLDQALKDCGESLRLAPNMPSALDSRGLVHLKRGDIDNAITDYNAALRLNPKLAESLYARGVAKQKKGDNLGAETDMAAAKALDSKIAETFAGYGVK